MGVYAMLDVDKRSAGIVANVTAKTLAEQYAANPEKFLTPDKYHVTLLYSRVGEASELVPVEREHVALIDKLEQWDTHDVCLVAKLDCDTLQQRHKFLMDKHGLQWDYESYQPHITLLYDIKLDADTFESLQRKLEGKVIILSNETIEPLDEDHSDLED